MAFENYIVKNNIKWKLSAWIGTWTLSLILWNDYINIFPQPTETRKYLLTIEKVEDWVVTRREIIKVITKVWAVLTITRSAWFCLASDTATTYTNTAFNFDAQDKISLYNVAENDDDIKTEIELKALDTAVVHKTGNETVAWVKTFTSIPFIPITLPTQQNQVVNKQYVDNATGGLWFKTASNFIYTKNLLTSFIWNWLNYVLTYNMQRNMIWVTNGVNTWEITYTRIWYVDTIIQTV